MKAGTKSHIKFKRLKCRLQLPDYCIVGVLESLWHVTAQHAPRGDIGKLTDEDIAALIDWACDPAELVRALVSAGWLDEHPDHRLIVHDWHDHCSRYVHGNIARKGTAFVTTDATADTADAIANAVTCSPTVQQTTVGNCSTVLQEPTVVPNSSTLLPSQAKPRRSKISICSETNLTPNPSNGFVEFWQLYPRKIGKGTALKSWDRLKAPEREAAVRAVVEQSVPGAQLDKASRVDAAGRCCVPYPTTWLNGRRWEDPAEVQVAQQPFVEARLGEHKPPATADELQEHKQQQIRLAVRRKFGGGRWMQGWLSARLEAPEFESEAEAIADYEQFCLEKRQAEIEATP